jgi:hypothetical protein
LATFVRAQAAARFHVLAFAEAQVHGRLVLTQGWQLQERADAHAWHSLCGVSSLVAALLLRAAPSTLVRFQDASNKKILINYFLF